MKIKYVTKRHNDLNKRLARSIVDDGKVFHKQFEMSEKID